MPQMKLATIILDWQLYPRQKVDRTHVGHIAEAIKAGTAVPPLIVDKASRRLVDGFHRYHAYLRIHGKEATDAKITVDLREHADDAAIFEAAGRYNAAHGKSMSTFDRIHYVARAQELGIDPDRIATALNTTVDRIQALTVSRTAIIGPDAKIEGSTARRVPLKRTIQHRAGGTLTPRQEQANDRLSGMRPAFYVNQVIELLDADLIEWDDDELVERLRQLDALLRAALEVHAGGAAA